MSLLRRSCRMTPTAYLFHRPFDLVHVVSRGLLASDSTDRARRRVPRSPQTGLDSRQRVELDGALEAQRGRVEEVALDPGPFIHAARCCSACRAIGREVPVAGGDDPVEAGVRIGQPPPDLLATSPPSLRAWNDTRTPAGQGRLRQLLRGRHRRNPRQHPRQLLIDAFENRATADTGQRRRCETTAGASIGRTTRDQHPRATRRSRHRPWHTD